ncbi:MAG: hypothetical protein JW720_14130 [Sedimentisphaerales bacterium]|nr:hypothetical protein [Sedimentisphaerales bacterium]
MRKTTLTPAILLLLSLVFSGRAASVIRGQQNSDPPERKNDLWRSLQQKQRKSPSPDASHPGNVFVDGEKVRIKIGGDVSPQAARWQAQDDGGNVIAEGAFEGGNRNVDLGEPGIGWYRIGFMDGNGGEVGWTTAAVLAKQANPTAQDSPVCVDSATAWFASNNPDRQERFAQLAALAQVNWIRDRMSWGGIQRGLDDFADNTTYDSAASLQAKYGLKVLQVFHDSPGWAADRQLDGSEGPKRFTRDLRVLYKFCKTMAQRYKGRVLAWEPWNEANITVFGGHTIDEMCAHQKAAYLGFKAADAKLTVCWNVYAGAGTPLHTQGVIENESWPYFETYNIHSYQKPEKYIEQFTPARQAACGRPIWITECGVPLPWQTGGPWHEISPEDQIKQAQFIARSYASSLFAGVNRHFFFILGNYGERNIQFGLLRHDQTPRPGYAALAATGRFLNGARCLGRWRQRNDEAVMVYAFDSAPDGKRNDVLIIWSQQPSEWSPPGEMHIKAVYDYLGRPIGRNIPQSIGISPLYAVLESGAAEKLQLEQPLRTSEFRTGKASPIVLQLQMPHIATNLDKQAHIVDVQSETKLDIFAYNFSDEAVEGVVIVEQVAGGFRLSPERMQVTLAPMDRKRLPISLKAEDTGEGTSSDGWIKLQGRFSQGRSSVLAFRLVSK